MFKKILDGFLFGIGFALAYFLCSMVYSHFLFERLTGWADSRPRPVLEKGEEAEVVEDSGESVPSAFSRPEEPEFSVFRHDDNRMEIPEGGGVLGISPLPRKGPDQARPDTFQLWLTESGLWKILTEGEKVSVEAMEYPEGDPMERFDRILMVEAGWRAGTSTMTVSADVAGRIRGGHDTERDDHLNGRLRATTEGVVFMMPAEYSTMNSE